MPTHISPARGRSTRRWRKLRAQAVNEGACMVCGHGDCDAGGHKIARSVAPELAEVKSNIGPIHHKPCPVCGRQCNQDMGTKSLDEMTNLNTSRDWFAS